MFRDKECFILKFKFKVYMHVKFINSIWNELYFYKKKIKSQNI